jgi:hypothetical protein
MIIEITVIVSLLVWVAVFAGWWLHQMVRMDSASHPKTPRGWRIVNGRTQPRDPFTHWFRDYPYDKFDVPDKNHPPFGQWFCG